MLFPRSRADVYLLVGDEGPAPPDEDALLPSTFLGALAATAEIQIKDCQNYKLSSQLWGKNNEVVMLAHSSPEGLVHFPIQGVPRMYLKAKKTFEEGYRC